MKPTVTTFAARRAKHLMAHMIPHQRRSAPRVRIGGRHPRRAEFPMNRRPAVPALLGLSLLFACAAAHAAPATRPATLLLGPDGLASLKQRIETSPAAKE